jgi:DNA-binding MarR family transcriptional regulator
LKTKDANSVISGQPGYLLRRMFQIAESHFAEEAAGLDLTSAQYGVLQIIDARPGIDQLRLSLATRWDRTTVSGVVTRLAMKKLVVRRRDERDNRSNTLFLTPAGKRLLRKARNVGLRAQRRALAPLTATERKQLCRLLERAIRAHEALGPYARSSPTLAYSAASPSRGR